jgi:adenine deaminase
MEQEITLQVDKERLMSWRKDVIQTALGNKPADLVIQNGKLVNVNTREVLDGGVAISGERIAAIGYVDYTVGEGTEILDAEGMFLVPGLIEGHMHTESSCVTLTELSKILLPRGVTTVLYAHEMANILGLRGMKVLREESQRVPLKVFFQTPTSVPWSAGLEMPGTTISVEDVQEMLDWEESVTLGESDYFDVVRLDEEILAKLDYAEAVGKMVNGHISVESDRDLMAAAAGAFYDDHECFTVEETLKKLRLGLGVIMREANIPDIAPAVTEHDVDTQNIMLCIDDKLANALYHQGGVDQTVRVAIQSGIDPVLAIQMATLNAAKHFRLDHDLGSISPGRIGDIIITDSLKEVQPAYVFVSGKLAARDGKFLMDLDPFIYPAWTKNTTQVKEDLSPEDFMIDPQIDQGEVSLNVLKITDFGFTKNLVPTDFTVSAGEIQVDTAGPYNLIAVAERHGGDGNVALGLAEGDLNIQRGAVGSSVGHDCHNITLLGENPEDIALCAEAIAEVGGGFAAVLDGEVIARVPLEIAGLTTQAPYQEVVKKLDEFEEAIRSKLGFPEVTFLVFNFIVLQSTPFKAAITDRGLIDVDGQKVVPLIRSTSPA